MNKYFATFTIEVEVDAVDKDDAVDTARQELSFGHITEYEVELFERDLADDD